MKFNEDVMNILVSFAKLKDLELNIHNVRFANNPHAPISKTHCDFYNSYGFYHKELIIWDDVSDASLLVRDIMREIEAKLDARWNINEDPVKSLHRLYYTASRANGKSFYASQVWRELTDKLIQEARRRGIPAITNVIFNDPATIVFWMDGTKTVVKAQDGEAFDKEKGLAMAIAKKSISDKGNYYDEFKRWL